MLSDLDSMVHCSIVFNPVGELFAAAASEISLKLLLLRLFLGGVRHLLMELDLFNPLEREREREK